MFTWTIEKGVAVAFDDLKLGDVFVMCGRLWMKMEAIAHGAELINAVCLLDGAVTGIDHDELVIPRKIKHITIQ